jgi:hypothetical protein
MKRRTLRGRVGATEVKRLIVDDGRLNHGYKVTAFHVWASSQSSGNDPEASLGLDYDMDGSWNASDNRQIAWAGQTTTSTTRMMQFDLIDPDHVVIMDLYINNFSSVEANYLVILEPVELTDDQAILSLIKERSQDDLR